MELGLCGKTALVFGAAGGLGGAIARALMVAADLDAGRLDAVVRDLAAGGAKAMPLVWDLADLSVIDGHIATITREFGAVDILVNNTGGPPPTTVSGQDPVMWEDYFRSMVLPVIAITDKVIPGMRQKKWGRIITSASSGIISPIPNLGISNALRMSLVGWSKTLSREVGRDGITANIIVPGRIATARISFLDDQKAKREGRPIEEVQAESISSIPVGRYGRPAEYGAMAAFLASEQAAYVTGSVVRVDGGFIASV
jgi:3-oxoacyl-[acyl-carrier protein] reductase